MSLTRAPSRMAVACAAVLTVSGLAVVGAVSTQPAAAATPTGYQSIRINEVTANAPDTFELYNAGSSSVDVTGWKASDSTFGTKVALTAVPAVIPSHGFATVASPVALDATDALAVFTGDDATMVDRVDWSGMAAGQEMARCGDGTGSWVVGLAGSSFGSPNTNCPAALPATSNSNVRINEVTSTTVPAGNDLVELFNAGTQPISLGSWTASDGDPAGHPLAVFSPTPASIPPGGYATFQSPNGIGLGDNDSVVVVDNLGNSIDSVTWATNAAKPSYERCPNAFGWYKTAAAGTASFGAANACASNLPPPPPAGGGSNLLGGGGALTAGCRPESPPDPSNPLSPNVLPWPGGLEVTIADNVCAFTTPTGPEGEDVSGLAFDPINPSTLWAVKNKNWVFKLMKSGGQWVPDPAFATSASQPGKQLHFKGDAGGTTLPDTEGMTIAPNGHLFITSERDNANKTVPKNTVMEFDPNAAGTSLTAINQWDLTADIGLSAAADANLGFEGVGFVPDSFLMTKGWLDPRTGLPYNPALYGLHYGGLFFAGLEKDGTLHPYALAEGATTFTPFPAIPTGQVSVMDVTFDAITQRIVATCDNTCHETHTLMDINLNGVFKPEVIYTNPDAMPDNNLEGFALAPLSTCINGWREAVFSDDGIWGVGGAGPAFGHALYSGQFPCAGHIRLPDDKDPN